MSAFAPNPQMKTPFNEPQQSIFGQKQQMPIVQQPPVNQQPMPIVQQPPVKPTLSTNEIFEIKSKIADIEMKIKANDANKISLQKELADLKTKLPSESWFKFWGGKRNAKSKKSKKSKKSRKSRKSRK
jgi:hypothetical protein